ncbi:hypothetical protein N7493_010274 [Penicillium malachiteum]|uniref:HypA-like protein n=1 Tax=Penicillium malachiteum TaxID=1324776 RepID=A0AAD6HCS3_9EURO|nr:hypothetical protein N7493_010274 [Penicillium malachiteum]
MAIATKIHLDPVKDKGVYSHGFQEDAARTASQVLQDDLEKHHVFFNDEGFHNHIVHGILSIYALGASSEQILAHYDRNKSYQRPVLPTNPDVVRDMQDRTKFQQHLGKEESYPNFLAYFQQAIDAQGVGGVLQEYVFAGDSRAETMLCRLYGGLLHPIIHLGFGLEFNQPAIVAQALAQAAVHDDWMGRDLFLPAEKLAGEGNTSGTKTSLELLKEIQENQILKDSVKWTDTNRIRDGILARAPQEMIKYAAQYTVSKEQVPERLADMINTVVYYTAAAQRRDKEIKIDFFFIHCVNSAIFFSKFMDLPYLDEKSKLRLLEWKGRMDLVMYVSRNSPSLLLDEVSKYPAKDSWDTVISRAVAHPTDDGHLAKLVRALAHGENVCQPFESGSPISGDMWLRIGNMVLVANSFPASTAVDSTAGCRDRGMWIRSTGFDEAWENFSGRARL